MSETPRIFAVRHLHADAMEVVAVEVAKSSEKVFTLRARHPALGHRVAILRSSRPAFTVDEAIDQEIEQQRRHLVQAESDAARARATIAKLEKRHLPQRFLP